jgi:hypothetical protein
MVSARTHTRKRCRSLGETLSTDPSTDLVHLARDMVPLIVKPLSTNRLWRLLHRLRVAPAVSRLLYPESTGREVAFSSRKCRLPLPPKRTRESWNRSGLLDCKNCPVESQRKFWRLTDAAEFQEPYEGFAAMNAWTGTRYRLIEEIWADTRSLSPAIEPQRSSLCEML